MMSLCCDVLKALEGRTLSVAESCTGGGIGASLTAVSGASKVFLGGVVSYTNEIKNRLLGIKLADLEQFGAVSEPVARAMASGVRSLTGSDVAVSVTGLAGPGGDEYGNPVGTVFVGYADETQNFAREYHFTGDRDAVRNQTIRAALELILEVVN
jgi:PncC family amidohydrolase